MGVRVQKMLGYGLSDIKFKRGKIVDPRINKAGIVGLNESDFDAAEEEYSVDRWRAFLSDRYDRVKKSSSNKSSEFELRLYLECEREWAAKTSPASVWSPEDCIYVGAPGQRILLLTPPEMLRGNKKDWRRYDDSMDWLDEYLDHKSAPRVRDLRWQPLSPYWSWIDDRTGKRVRNPDNYAYATDDVAEEWSTGNADRHSSADRKHYAAIAQSIGFSDMDDVRKHMVPEIPLSLRLFCEFGQIFTSEKLVFALRPMLVVSWL